MTKQEEAKMWEHLSGYQTGSYVGSHCGMPIFEVKDIPRVYAHDGVELKGKPDGIGGFIFKDER